MLFASIKAAISGILVATVSEVSRRSPAFGGLIASLPIVSVLAMIWMWVEGADEARIADHSLATFWFVLPSLPMFLILPVLLRSGVHFVPSLVLSCVVTVALYVLMAGVLRHFGIEL